MRKYKEERDMRKRKFDYINILTVKYFYAGILISILAYYTKFIHVSLRISRLTLTMLGNFGRFNLNLI